MTAKLIHVTRDSTSVVGVLFPPLSGFLFLLGSWFFWPSIFGMGVNTLGAALFVVGSLLGLVVQFMELYRFRVYVEELERDAQHECAPINFCRLPSRHAPEPGSPDYTYKVHAYAIHISFTAAITYLLGCLLYLIGSVLFFPQFPEYYLMHAAWILILGACLNCIGAVIDYNSGWDSWEQSQRQSLTATSNAGVNINSSSSTRLYFLANFTFGVGAIFFFPVITDADNTFDYTGVTLFVVGSVMFLVAALLDVMLLVTPAPRQLHEDTSLVADHMSKKDPGYGAVGRAHAFFDSNIVYD